MGKKLVTAQVSKQQVVTILLISLFVFYTVAAVLISIVVPLGGSPDEPAHFMFVQYVAQNGRLPVMQPRYTDNATVEAFQAPAYYVLAALVTRPFMEGDIVLFRNPAFTFGTQSPMFLPLEEQRFPWHGVYCAWHLARFFSITLGWITLGATYCSARLVFKNHWLALAATAYIAMNPQFIYLNSMVTNDVLAATAGSLLTLAAFNLLDNSSLKNVVLIALTIGLAALTKPSTLTILPGIGWAFFIAWRKTPSTRARWVSLGLIMGIPLACSGWWFLRNQQLYGDFLGLAAAKQALSSNYYAAPLTLGQLLDILPQMARQTFQTYWGYFGWIAFPLSDIAYFVILFLNLLALIGLLWRSKFLRRNVQALVLGTMWLGMMFGFLYYNLETNSSGWQGRFLFPGLSVTAIGFIAGWSTWLRRREVLIGSLVMSLGLLLSVYAMLGVVMPAYLPPSPVPMEAVSNTGDTKFAGDLVLVGYELQSERVKPGDNVQLTLYWSVQKLTETPYLFRVDGYTVHGDSIVRQTESNLARRFPSIVWPANQVLADRYTLRVSETYSQVVCSLGLQVIEGYEEPHSIFFNDSGGNPIGERLELGPLIISGNSQLRGGTDINAQFGTDEILLTGYDINPAIIKAGTPLTVTLAWRAQQQPTANYQVFVHLFDDKGQLVAQHDGSPKMGLYPTSAWSARENIIDLHVIQIPETVAGTLHPCVGLYALETLERLPVTWNNSTDCPDQSVPLAAFTVKQ
ncbi:MAG TPA: hypothetical protein G4N98_06435 [Thermoflexia bacterium]|nr:hypothetical protein [Thermoflexia bacterium]